MVRIGHARALPLFCLYYSDLEDDGDCRRVREAYFIDLDFHRPQSHFFLPAQLFDSGEYYLQVSAMRVSREVKHWEV